MKAHIDSYRMLRELNISNLAVIQNATVELSEGLNIFTGQTGAGKSLVIGALEILLGLKSGGREEAGAMIRHGHQEARVSGLFEILDQDAANMIGNAIDRQVSVGDDLVITRRIFSSGRTSASVDGSPVTVGMLKVLAESLVDIHGQHDHQHLLRPSSQLNILDNYSGSNELRQQYAEGYSRVRQLREKLETLEESSQTRQRELQLLQFQANEIDQVAPEEGQLEAVKQEYGRLSGAGNLLAAASDGVNILYESEGSVVEKLETLSRQFNELLPLDREKLAPVCQQLAQSAIDLQEMAYDLGRYVDTLEIDESRLDEVENHLDSLNHIAHKYGGTLQAAIQHRQEIESRINDLTGDSDDLEKIGSEISALEENLQKIGKSLTRKRKDGAKKLAPLITEKIGELGMQKAGFSVAVDSSESSISGLDRVEFMVATNPGQPARELRKIASGGEISRGMLAIKSIMAASDRISVMVFDEIDANIGGRIGAVIGQCMRELCANSSHQVLCITHLPQIAAFADNHIRISKDISDDTSTTVKPLYGEDRLNEIAEMIAGKVTEASLNQARELLKARTGTSSKIQVTEQAIKDSN